MNEPSSFSDRLNRLNRIPQFHFDHGNAWGCQWKLRADNPGAEQCLAELESAYLPYEGRAVDTTLAVVCRIKMEVRHE